jgi:neogenin
MPPIGVKAVMLSPTSALLTWTDTTLGRNQRTANDGRHYIVRYNPKVVHKQRLVNVTDLSTQLNDLRPDTEYEFSVKVVKGHRQSTWSLSVFNRTQEAAPSTAPRDLTVVSVDGRPSWVSLSWQPPRQSNGLITGYVVLYTTDTTQPDREWLVEAVIGDRTSVTIRDLVSQTPYFFKVQARNSIGNGPMSPTVIYRSPGFDGDVDGLADEALTYGSRGSQLYGGASNGTIPSYVLWILIACISGVSVIAGAIVVAVVCRRRHANKQAAQSESDNTGPKTGPIDLKPPDLWIHDQVEHRRTSHASNGANSADAAPSIAGSQDIDDSAFSSVSLETVQEDERYRRPTVRPLMIPIDHPPQPRDPLALLKPSSGNITSPESSTFAGLGAVRTGLFPRPSALQYMHSSTPRVNAGDLCQPSLQADYALSTLERHRMIRDSQKQLVRPTASRPATSSTTSIVPSILSMPTKTRSPLPTLLSRSPDVTLQTEASGGGSTDLPKSVSTEELTAEMANLEGLMKDLNAITQHEFQC